MGKIFLYELRRAVASKFFFGLLAVCLFFGWQTLTTQTIQGVAHTAPFSPWSFASYLAQALPLLCVALLFFLWGVFSGSARQVEALADATPAPKGRYLLTRCAAVAVAWLLLAAAVTGLGLGFLIRLFGPDVPVWQLAGAGLAVLLPGPVLLLGLGLLAGRLHPALALGLIPLCLAGNLLLPPALQPFGGGFFAQYPLALGTDPGFSLPPQMAASKLAYALCGLLLLLWCVRDKKKARD